MLFADIKNFSQLHDKQAPLFFAFFLDEVEHLIRAAKDKLVFWNTWGDGLFLVFNSVLHCADFTMQLLDWVEQVNWVEMGLPKDLTIRVGIHTGPVFPLMDKIINRRNFFGMNVNRTARIEPVTMPGCAFASEQFVASLMTEPGHKYTCEYIGVEELSKGFDRCPLYRLAHR
jgi:class 3 adenylate cyclase